MFEPVRFGKYLLIEKVATGGMAEVYKAKSYGVMGFEKLLVIKKILPHLSQSEEFVSLFVNEAKVSVSLNHANIIQVYDLGVVGSDYYIAMEYIHGPDLMRTIRKAKQSRTPIDVPIGCYIVMEIVRGLDYAHNLKDPAGRPLNVVHRDVSPHNVMLGYEGDVKLLDFGIAQVGRDLVPEGRPAGGKYGYMSPEHLGASPVDARSDVYSAGIVLFELVTGKRLYAGMSVEEKKAAIVRGTIPRPSKIAAIEPQLEEIIFTALARDPDLRFKDAQSLQRALQDYLYRSSSNVTRADLGVYLKGLFVEEYSREAAAGSVINNFEPQFDPLATPAGASLEPATPLAGGSELTEDESNTGTLGEPDDVTSEESVSLSGVSGVSLEGIETIGRKKRERLAEGELRKVYILAADVLGIDRLSSDLDEAELLRFNYRFLRTLLKTVRRHKGTLDRFYNDRFLIFWGLKRTSERDLELCLDCAQSLTDFGEAFDTHGRTVVQLCMGVHRGTLAAGGSSSRRRVRKFVPLGDTLKMATRLCEVAEAGQVLVSDRVVSQAVDERRFERLEPLRIKGWEERVQVHLLRPETDEVETPRATGAWIPRGDELTELDHAIETVREGRGVALSVVAESGSGKTRFLHEIHRRVSEEEIPFYLGKGRVQRGQEPLLPIGDVLRQMAGLDIAADEVSIREKLSVLAKTCDLSELETNLLGTLFGLAMPDSGLRYLASDQRLAELFRALLHLMRARTERSPCVIAIQNLQWADRLTQEFVRHAREETGDHPLMIVATVRPEDPPPFGGDASGAVEIRLPGWGADEVMVYCREYLGVADIPPALVEFVLEASGGNALFVKELLRSLTREERVVVGDAGIEIPGRLRRSSVPDTVQDLVESRLDALQKDQRKALEVAAVVGRTFSFDVVTGVLGVPAGRAEQIFEELVETDLIRPRTGEGAAATYQFRNVLTWEVTYRGLITVTRRELHCRVGEAIEALYVDALRPYYDVLCAHFTEGSQMEQAALYAERAGLVHAERNYTQQAIRRFQQSILLLRSAGADASESDVNRRLSEIYWRLADLSAREGDLKTALRHGTMSLDYATDVGAPIEEARVMLTLCRVETELGHDSTVGAYLERLEEISGQIIDHTTRAEIRRGLAGVLAARGAAGDAMKALEAALSDAREACDAAIEAGVLKELGGHRVRDGQHEAAATAFREAQSLVKGLDDPGLLADTTRDLAIAQERSGDVAQALKSFQRAYRLHKNLDDKRGMVLALNHIGQLQMKLDDRKKAARYFRRSMTVADDCDWKPGIALAEVFVGYLRQQRRASTPGDKQLRRGIRRALKAASWEAVAIGKAFRARLAAKDGDDRRSRRLFKEATEAAVKAGDPGLLESLP